MAQEGPDVPAVVDTDPAGEASQGALTASGGRLEHFGNDAVSPYDGPTVILYPPAVYADACGDLVVEPHVEFRGDGPPLTASYDQMGPSPGLDFDGTGSEMLPIPDSAGMGWSAGGEGSRYDAACATCLPAGDPMLGDVIQQGSCCQPWYLSWLPAACLTSGGSAFSERGIGHERVMHAPFMIDTTQPGNKYALQYFAGYGWESPDRSEYFWARTVMGRGPKQPETSVDAQEVRFHIEVGGETFSTTTTIPLRCVNPDRNLNHSGLGDLSLTTKLRMFNGKRWQVTQLFRTYFNTASPSMGLGTGHISLEPGLLFRFGWTDRTYLHAELKYWFALGGDPLYSGQVLRWGLGLSRIWYESDEWAVVPTLEFVQWTALNGQQTSATTGLPVEVDGEGIFNIHPGLRFVHDTGGDWGLFEYGLVTGFATTNDHWYDFMLRLDARWVY
jgi:hypothetical protein